MSGALHITSGDSAAGGLLVGLGLPRDAVLVHRDVLSCGPLPPIDDLAAWLAARRRFWDGLLLEESRDAPSTVGRSESDLTAQLARLGAAESVTLWLGRALSDQLLLAWLVKLAEAIQFDLGRLRVVQWMDDPATGLVVRGMGELAPDRIARHPAPRHLTDGDIEEARRAWDAVTAPSADDLLDLIAGRGHSPALRPALAFLVDRYPDVASGLGRWDQLLLDQIDGVPRVPNVVARTLVVALDTLDCVGDIYLAARLRRLAAGEHPLVTLNGQGHQATVSLTDAGREVLAGRASALALNGLDDWVCGVHLQSSVGPVWFRRGGILLRSIP